MNEYKILSLSQIDNRGLERLACLHESVMHTLLTNLGLPVVLQYYRIAKSDSSVIGRYASATDGEIIGWAMGSPDPKALNSRLKNHFLWFAGQMFRLIITNPNVIWQVINSTFSSSDQMEGDHAIELTYIGVAADERGKDIGFSLLNEFINASRRSGYRSVVLSVEKENTEAMSLYTKSGFIITKTFKEGRFERCRMELFL